ncbi:hypothetical protein FB451DRAFT_1184386 [Mycena latifolia]|nr:hypothetical protein FB451DRAFT_1184386 [Mycena latifolia]
MYGRCFGFRCNPVYNTPHPTGIYQNPTDDIKICRVLNDGYSKSSTLPELSPYSPATEFAFIEDKPPEYSGVRCIDAETVEYSEIRCTKRGFSKDPMGSDIHQRTPMYAALRPAQVVQVIDHPGFMSPGAALPARMAGTIQNLWIQGGARSDRKMMWRADYRACSSYGAHSVQVTAAAAERIKAIAAVERMSAIAVAAECMKAIKTATEREPRLNHRSQEEECELGAGRRGLGVELNRERMVRISCEPATGAWQRRAKDQMSLKLERESGTAREGPGVVAQGSPSVLRVKLGFLAANTRGQQTGGGSPT